MADAATILLGIAFFFGGLVFLVMAIVFVAKLFGVLLDD